MSSLNILIPSLPRTKQPKPIKTLLCAIGVSALLALSACSSAPTTMPQPAASQNPNGNKMPVQLGNSPFTQCPPYNPENTICTAQYDPVCVKVKSGTTISYRTAGNACSACRTVAAIGYIKGQCPSDVK